MSPERWLELKGKIQDEFELLDNRITPLDPGPGQVEILLFKTPAATMKLEFTTKPRVIGERGMGSRRIGSSVQIERQYSDTETVTYFAAFRQVPGTDQWTEMAPDAIG